MNLYDKSFLSMYHLWKSDEYRLHNRNLKNTGRLLGCLLYHSEKVAIFVGLRPDFECCVGFSARGWGCCRFSDRDASRGLKTGNIRNPRAENPTQHSKSGLNSNYNSKKFTIYQNFVLFTWIASRNNWKHRITRHAREHAPSFSWLLELVADTPAAFPWRFNTVALQA